MSVTRELPDVRFTELGLCRGHERLQGLAISNSTDDSGASWRPSVGDHSSVDRQGCTDDVGCLVRANEHDGICNFFGSADALVRNLCVEEIYFVFLRLRKAVEHSGFHRTRANDVDTNACAGEFDGRRLRDAFHGVLAADIHRRGRATDFAVRRRDVNDAAFALPKHSPNLVLHAQKHTKHICVEDGVIVLGGYIGNRTGSALGASVIDGNIEATETSDGLATRFLTSSSCRTSVRRNSASVPSLRSSVASLWPSSSCRPETTTRAPSCAKARAVARPMPVSAPVISTVGVFVLMS